MRLAAINGKTIARRNAQKILAALNRQFQAQGNKAYIGMVSIKGLNIADLQRKTTKSRQVKASEEMNVTDLAHADEEE